MESINIIDDKFEREVTSGWLLPAALYVSGKIKDKRWTYLGKWAVIGLSFGLLIGMLCSMGGV